MTLLQNKNGEKWTNESTVNENVWTDYYQLVDGVGQRLNHPLAIVEFLLKMALGLQHSLDFGAQRILFNFYTLQVAFDVLDVFGTSFQSGLLATEGETKY